MLAGNEFPFRPLGRTEACKDQTKSPGLGEQLRRASPSTVNNDELISAAESILRPRVVKGRRFGDVGAAILSASGRLFLGISVDTPS